MHKVYLIFLIVGFAFAGCSKESNHPLDIRIRREITYEDKNVGPGSYKIAVTCDTLGNGTPIFLIENIGEKEVFLISDYFYFEDASQKIIGQMGSRGLFLALKGPTMNLDIPIGKREGFAIEAPKVTKSILVKNDQDVVLFRLYIR